MVAGCRKFVQVDPPANSLVSSTVFASNATAASALTGIFATMSGSRFDGPNSLDGLLGLLADEFRNYSNNSIFIQQCYTNSLSSTGDDPFWTPFYKLIYDANAAIDGLDGSTGVTPALKQQLKGEAEFIRAFFHFYLVNLFGDVPLVTTTNYQANNVLARMPKAQVYRQIVSDLKDAQNLLGVNFLDPTGATTGERVRPNKGAATRLTGKSIFIHGGV